MNATPRLLRLITFVAIFLPGDAPGELASAQSPPINPASDQTGDTIRVRNGVVVSASVLASTVGRDVLKQGGNAVDAAVATAFALAVTWPEAGNIGGGGFMLVRAGNGQPSTFFDFRETAPLAATKEMFAKPGGRTQQTLVGVPGTVRGLGLAHKRLGKLPWKDLVLPAVRSAREGFSVDAPLARSLNGVLKHAEGFPELQRVYGKPGGGVWQPGDRLVQLDLAQTLQLIADGGPDAFYTGAIAEQVVAEMRDHGGLITAADLAAYRAKEREPVHGTFHGFDIYSAPPPSSGGICLIEMLNILEGLNLRERGRWNAQTLHFIIESMRRGYRDRAEFLGDPDFVKIPAHLTSKEYAASLARAIDPTKATPSEDLSREIPLTSESEQTTHFDVIDKDAMAVSCTYTLEQSFGGKIVVHGAGFLLNNEMGDFNSRPGRTDRNGMIGTPPNTIEPAKRMLSSMAPTIVERDGKVVLVTGSPGGRTIINTVFQVVLNVCEFNMSARDAVDAPRLHHAWFPDSLTCEPGLLKDHADAIAALRMLGQKFDAHPSTLGRAHTIFVDPKTGEYEGIADRRNDGAAAGW